MAESNEKLFISKMDTLDDVKLDKNVTGDDDEVEIDSDNSNTLTNFMAGTKIISQYQGCDGLKRFLRIHAQPNDPDSNPKNLNPCDPFLRFFRVQNEKFEEHETSLRCLTVDHVNGFFVSGGLDGFVKVWN